MIYPRQWENINDYSSRLKVPGGWIVSSVAFYEDTVSKSITFVPDKDHQWFLEDIKSE